MHRRTLFLALTPLWLAASSVVQYGEDPLTQGLSLQAFALGQIRALPLETPSIGGNVATLADRAWFLNAQHTEAFGGIYQTDVVQLVKGPWSAAVFRGGVTGIADTRGALEDFGADGIANTGDTGEGNGIFDPGERLNLSAISFFNVQQWVGEAGYTGRVSDKIAYSTQMRIIIHDLDTQTGFGVGFHAGLLYQPGRNLILGLQATNLLTTTVFWNSGTREHYPPALFAGVKYHFSLAENALSISPLVQVEYQMKSLAGLAATGHLGLALGTEISFQDQIKLRLGRSSADQFTVGAGIITRYFNVDYATAFSTLSKVAGQSHRVGVQIHLSQLPFWR